MTTTSREPTPSETGTEREVVTDAVTGHRARVAFAANAAVAWLDVVLTVVLSGLGAYEALRRPPSSPAGRASPTRSCTS